MNTIPDVYLFGQVLGTHSFLLKDGFLQPGIELAKKHFIMHIFHVALYSQQS